MDTPFDGADEVLAMMALVFVSVTMIEVRLRAMATLDGEGSAWSASSIERRSWATGSVHDHHK